MEMSIWTKSLTHIFLTNQLDKLNNLSQNDQWVLIKWDYLCILHTYILPPIYNFTTYLPTNPTHLPTYLHTTYLDILPTYLFTCLSTHL
jgi:hypothetical protein